MSLRKAHGAWLSAASVILLLVLAPSARGAAESYQEVLVGFRGAPDAARVQALGGRVKQVFSLVPALAATVPTSALTALRRDSRIAYVEPDYPVYATGVSPNLTHTISPLFDPSIETLPWGLSRVRAPEVWLATPPNTGASIKVAIIDTGIDYTHPDLSANYLLGYDFVNKDWDPKDDNGHGTHVAGIIAAVDDGPNYGGFSVIGVAPQVSLYIAKALDANGVGSTSNLVAALDAAARYGVDVVNMSLGSPFSSKTLQSACDRAYRAGVLLVAAAGNEALPILDAPARYSSVVSVGAINAANQRATFSNYSKYLELCAPGVDVLSTLPTYTVTLNGALYGYQMNYDYLSGTSMACPHVTGAAALVLAAYPTWTNAQVRQQLVATATDLGAPGRDNYYGYGLVDAAAAVGLE